MTIYTNLLITSPLTVAGFKSQCDLAPGQLPALNNFVDYVVALAGGNQSALLGFQVGAVKASGTITQTSTGAANSQTCTILGVTFTALTSGHVTGEATWNRNNTVATSATNLAAAINGYAPFSGIVTATSLLGVVTVTATQPGIGGNGLFMANVDLANTTIVSFAGGSNGTAYTLDLR